MDFEEAVAAHRHWKNCLLDAIAGLVQDGVDPDAVATDTACALGKWIHGEAQKFDSFPEFQTLLREHADFHRYAFEVLQDVNEGHPEVAKLSLNSGEYYRASQRVVQAILALRHRVAGVDLNEMG